MQESERKSKGEMKGNDRNKKEKGGGKVRGKIILEHRILV